MLNGWLDIPASDVVTPYIGGGIGGASVAIDAGAPGIACNYCQFDGREFVFAWQLGAGVSVGSPGGPQLTIDYRLFNADSIGVSTGEIFPGATSNYNAQSIMIGFRIPIGAPN
jgi:opacity protein-like surface antigen